MIDMLSVTVVKIQFVAIVCFVCMCVYIDYAKYSFPFACVEGMAYAWIRNL